MNHPDILKAVHDYFDNMSSEEFRKILEDMEKDIDRCDPETCQGQCQGMGWCYTCEDFRGDAPDDEAEERLP